MSSFPKLELSKFNDGTTRLSYWSIYGNDLHYILNEDGTVLLQRFDPETETDVITPVDLVSELRTLADKVYEGDFDGEE